MKRIRKKMTAVLLSCSLLLGGVAGHYETARAAEIAAGYTVAQILEGIFLSFGISIFTADMINQAANPNYWGNGWVDGNAALQPTYEELEAEYNRARWEILNGGGGEPKPSPTPEPNPTTEPNPEPEPEPVPGEIPTFAEWVAGVVGTGVIAFNEGVWDCMGKAVSSLWDKILNRVELPQTVPSQALNVIAGSGCPYFIYFYNSSYNLYLCKEGSFFSGSSRYSTGEYIYKAASKTADFILTSSREDGVVGSNLSNYKPVHNLPVFSTYEEGLKWRERVSKIPNGEVIWVHPDLEDTFENKGKLEYPQQAPRPLEIPSTEQLADTAKKLNPEYNPQYDPNTALEYIRQLIEQLQCAPNPNPDPGVDPNPEPGVDPNPNPDPDPAPELSPTPSPEPDDGEEENVNMPDYITDLTKIFPFCIPFDLVHLIDALDAEPVAPRFEIPIDISFSNPYSGKKVVDYHHVFIIDMAQFESVVDIVRKFEVVLFLIGLMMITRQHMIKG